MTKFSFGTDPEFMLIKNNKIYSAIGIVKGNKERRKKIGDYAFFHDNVLAECSVPPAHSKAEAIKTIGEALQKYSDLVKPYQIELRASHVYDKDQLNRPEALEIGCSPESCVYTLDTIEVDEEFFVNTSLRSAGGHIHLGGEVVQRGTGFNALTAVRLLDLFLGVPAIYIDHDPTSKKRKELYGRAGRFRLPEAGYGLEYRSMGNFWLLSPELVGLVYDICDFVLGLIQDKKSDEFWSIDENRLKDRAAWSDPKFHPIQCHVCKLYDTKVLRKAVDKMDQKQGNQFLELIKKYLPSKIFNQIETAMTPSSTDIYRNWSLK